MKRNASNHHAKPCPYCGREIKGNAGMASHMRRHRQDEAVRKVLARPPSPKPQWTWNTETKKWEPPTKLVPVDPPGFRKNLARVLGRATVEDIDWFGEKRD